MTFAAKRALVDDILAEFKVATGGQFLEWVYDVLFELDEDEIPTDERVEGSGEKQIDVLRVDDDTHTNTAKISVIQTKETVGFSSNTVILISNGISTIVETRKADLRKLTNHTLAAKIYEIRELLRRYGYGAVELNVYYATLGNAQQISKETKSEIERLGRKWSALGFDKFSFNLLGASELYDLWWQKNTSDRNISEDIHIIYDVNRASIIEFEVDDCKAVICTVTGREIARLAALQPKDAIFDMNLREHLGTSGRVNVSILDGCQKDTEAATFWFKNNGITMVCSHLDVAKDPDDPVVKVQNLQIVNGCQTSVTLREANRLGTLRDSVRVLTKIYQIANRDLISDIVLATNNQNSILSRDLYANDECQLLIQQIIAQKLGLFYERKRGEARSKGRSRGETIDSEKAGQAYLAIKKKLPTVSRAQKYRIYEDELYLEIFRKSDPLQLALCYFLYESCKRRGTKRSRTLKKGNEEHSLLTYGVFHLARVFAFFVCGGEDLPCREDEVVAIISRLRNEEGKFDRAFNKAVKLCLRVLKKAKVDSANNYFKSQTAQQQITAAVGRATA